MASAYPAAYNTYVTITSTDNLNTAGKEHDIRSTSYEDNLYALEHTLGLAPAGSDASVKARLDRIDSSLGSGTTVGNWKPAVKAVFTSNVTQSGARTADTYGAFGTGVSCVAGDRVLCVGQTDAKTNGIFVVASGAWSRPSDANSGALIAGGAVPCMQGDAHSDSIWFCTNDTISIGTTNIAFKEIVGQHGGHSAQTNIAAVNAPPFWKFTADVICDGVQDNLDIEAALTLTLSQGDATGKQMGSVKLSPGIFLIATDINMPENSKLEGSTPGYAGSTGSIYGVSGKDYSFGTVLRNSTAGAAHGVMKMYGTDANNWGANYVIRDLTMQGVDCTKPLLDMKYASLFYIENVHFWSSANAGVEIRRSQDGGFWQCRWDWCGTRGATGGNQRAAVHMLYNAADAGSCNNIDLTNCYWENCTDGDLWMFGDASHRINKCTIRKAKLESHTSYAYPRVHIEYADQMYLDGIDITIGGTKNAATPAVAAILVKESHGVQANFVCATWAGGLTNTQYHTLIEYDGSAMCSLDGVYVNQGTGYFDQVLALRNVPDQIAYRNIFIVWYGDGVGHTGIINTVDGLGHEGPAGNIFNRGWATIAAGATYVDHPHGMRSVPDIGYLVLTPNAVGNFETAYTSTTTRTGNVVTVAGLPTGHGFAAGMQIEVRSATDAANYNGRFSVATATTNGITYYDPRPDRAAATAGVIVCSPGVLNHDWVNSGTTTFRIVAERPINKSYLIGWYAESQTSQAKGGT